MWTAKRLRLYVHEHLSTDSQRTHHRQMIPCKRDTEHRRPATRHIGANTRQQQLEASFVYPGDGSRFRVGLFEVRPALIPPGLKRGGVLLCRLRDWSLHGLTQSTNQ